MASPQTLENNIEESGNKNERAENDQDEENTSVQVAVRVRPFLARETGATVCIDIDQSQSTVQIGGAGGPFFTYDHALPPSTNQIQLYSTCVVPLVKACLTGYNATVLAYGQTGSGKTHTVVGPSIEEEIYNANHENSSTSSEFSGIIPRAFRDLFQHLEEKKKSLCPPNVTSSKKKSNSDSYNSSRQPYEYDIRIQFLELYGEEIRDLLSPSPASTSGRLTIRDGAAGEEAEVIGAIEARVNTTKEALECLHYGTLRRVTAATQMNTESSRSHAILTISVEQRTLTKLLHSTTLEEDGEQNPGDEEIEAEEEVKRSKFHFVDLAGSERQKRTKSEGLRLKEGIDINLGLLVLGNVISALGDSSKSKRTHVPYRDSKLTRLLKGSLGGNHKTLMIACVSPASINMEESLNCLRYANRAKNIKNNAVVNLDPKSRLIADLREKCRQLTKEVLRVRSVYKENINDSSVDIEDGSPFTQQMLLDLVAGKDVKISKPNSLSENTLTNLTNSSPIAYLNKNDNLVTPTSESSMESQQIRLQLAETKAELDVLRQSSRDTKEQISILAEQCYSAKAEAEYYRLQLSGKTNHIIEEDKDKSFTSHTSVEVYDLSSSLIPKQVFIQKVTHYEKKITLLRDQLRQEKSKLSVNAEPYKRKPSLDEDDESELQMKGLTQKYLADDSDIESSKSSNSTANSLNLAKKLEATDILHNNRNNHLDASISQLTKNILEKEELVEQLNASRSKYEAMRVFYEEKLEEMENQVRLKQAEREKMIENLEKMKTNKNSRAKNINKLQISLDEKEKRISYLKRQQKELSKLTMVSSRNVTIIHRLQQDIAEMKRKKMDLERQVINERKSHMQEINRLKKEALFRDKEVSKWKQQSNKNSSAADNARRVAKSRLEDISKLRTKYKDAEKRLRKQTLKNGFLARAGVDSAMVGRKDTSRNSNKSRDRKRLNVDHLRKFLDKRVTDIGKMEQTAEKIANEWEEHLELMYRKREVLDKSEQEEKDYSEELDALAVQIKYKENRIRKLTRKLGAKPFMNRKGWMKGNNTVSFLEDEQFKHLSFGLSPLSAIQSTCKVLFGMVVRERRRVVNLARTACNLDTLCMDKEKSLQSNIAAFRSYEQEEKAERFKLARQHQEDILSLMAIVKTNDEKSDMKSTEDILAYGGLSNLEAEVRALRNDREEKLMYQKELEEIKILYHKKEQECEQLQLKLSLPLSPTGENLPGNEHYSNGKMSENEFSNNYRNERTKETTSQDRLSRSNVIAMIESSDEEDLEDGPEWADDIMSDLAMIAEGEMPPSLQQTQHSFDSFSESRLSAPVMLKRSISTPIATDSVFDRLADPHNFTGVQKQRQTSKYAWRRRRSEPKSPERGPNRNLDISRHRPRSSMDSWSSPKYSSRASLSSDGFSYGSPHLESSRSPPVIEANKSSSGYNSVYERLHDPSNFTGIQKAVFEHNDRVSRRRRWSPSSN